MDLNLNGKVVLVTGGSRGIGRGIAKLLSEAGAKVALTYQSNEVAAQETLKDLKGSGHKIYKLNIADIANVEEVMGQVQAEMGGLNVLVNNAGITKDQLLLRMKVEDWDQV